MKTVSLLEYIQHSDSWQQGKFTMLITAKFISDPISYYHHILIVHVCSGMDSRAR